MTFTSVILISVHFKKRRRSAVKKFYTQRTVKYLPVPTVHNKFFFMKIGEKVMILLTYKHDLKKR